MERLGLMDLEVMRLGIKRDGTFDEQDLERSDLKRLGVGRILDLLASMKDRNLIELNSNGTFSVTDLARHTLWDRQMPLWVRVLRLLDIKSFEIKDISDFLKESEENVFVEIELLRKNQMVLMSPQRIESRITKVYEILPEGKEKIKDVEREGFEKHSISKNPHPEIEILAMLNHVIKQISDSEMSPERKESITTSLSQIKDKLKI